MSSRVGVVSYVEAYDFILYLARLLRQLGKQVLIVGKKKDGGLQASVPAPAGMPAGQLVHYRGIDCIFGGNESAGQDYDVIITEYPERCFFQQDELSETMLIYLTDYQIHNVESMVERIRQSPRGAGKDMVVIRADSGVNKFRYLKKQLPGVGYMKQVAEDDATRRIRLYCQYNNVFRFRRIGSDYKNVLIDAAGRILADGADYKSCKAALRRAEKGA